MLMDVFDVLRSDIAIDLGTANTLVYSSKQGIVLDEPSVVAMLDKKGKPEIIAVGEQAKSMIGRNPKHIKIIRPMQDGVISDFIATEEMIKQFIKITVNKMSLAAPRVMMCVPASATQVEKRAMFQATYAAGAKKVYIMPEPVAAAIGAGLDIGQPHGSMVIDIGGGTTDIAVMSLGGIIRAHSFRVAGDAMDRAIVDYVRSKHHLLIGTLNAEIMKKQVGSALWDKNDKHANVRIKGRHLRTGMPSECVLDNSDIAKALAAPLEYIATEARKTLEELPPEIAADILEQGIHLTGGGALLKRIDKVMEEKTGVTFSIPSDPLRCVVIGAGLALENVDRLSNMVLEVK